MSNPINELLQKYATLGWEHWNKRSNEFKRQAERQIGVDIAASQWKAENAATNPFQPAAANGKRMELIPMPCDQKNLSAAFFVPWAGGKDQSDLSFDLIVLLDQGSPCTFAFRFEPASQDSGSTHGYDHMQLNNSLGKRQVPLDNALSRLPTTYPAFPVPSKDPTTRFLAMVVSMHGYPSKVNEILNRAFNGQPNKSKSYQNLARKMLEP